MATSILDALEHFCFKSPRLHQHQHPELYICPEEKCHAAITPEIAKMAQVHDTETDKVSCPGCGCGMTHRPAKTVTEVHVHLCMDQTIHYPRMYKAGKLSKEDFEAWKATLTPAELLGHYKRVPDQHMVTELTEDEAALMTSDPAQFQTVLNQRVRERAEKTMLTQVPHRHQTTTQKVKVSTTI